MNLNELIKYKEIDDIPEYAISILKSGKAEVDEVFKHTRIRAKRGVAGERIDTIVDGRVETPDGEYVSIDEKTGKPGWVVIGAHGEKYIISDSTFISLYDEDPERPGEFISKGAPVLSLKLDENVRLHTSFGLQDIPAGGYLLMKSNKKIYGIDEKVYEDTYKRTGKKPEECLKKALQMFGLDNNNDKETDEI